MAAKILIVDESATVQAALPSNEYMISTAARTLELSAACATSAPDVILRGLTLQGVDCSELLRSIQKQRLTSNTPVIILTCQSADPQIGRALDAGAVDCICQPVSDFVVQARVRNALQTSRLLKERQLTEESEHAAAKTRNDMLAEISCEIRTTMTTILGYTDVLIDKNRGQVENGDPLETIKRNGRELLHVVDDVLDVSQIEAGTLKVGQLKCSPRQLVAAVISQMQAKAEAKGLRLESSFVESVPLCVRTDPIIANSWQSCGQRDPIGRRQHYAGDHVPVGSKGRIDTAIRCHRNGSGRDRARPEGRSSTLDAERPLFAKRGGWRGAAVDNYPAMVPSAGWRRRRSLCKWVGMRLSADNFGCRLRGQPAACTGRQSCREI